MKPYLELLLKQKSHWKCVYDTIQLPYVVRHIRSQSNGVLFVATATIHQVLN
jgi:hypothetical protein